MTDPAPYPDFDGTQSCRRLDPEEFFPEGRHGPRSLPSPAARQACRTCPFLRGCLAYALTHGVEGIWGGTTDAERDQLRARHGIDPDMSGLDLSALFGGERVSNEDLQLAHRGGGFGR